ncbi:MAG: PadR family transcriptional regulator [Sphingomonadales bacterium]
MDVKTLCLGILSLGDATGYEIKKLVADGAFSFFSEASYGSIYPALTKLMDSGLVTCRSESQDGRPDKKIYSLTEDGEQTLKSSMRQSPGPDKQRSEFLASVLFSEAVYPERVTQLISERKLYHEDRIRSLTSLQQEELSPAGRIVIGYGLHIQRAALAFLEDAGELLVQDVESDVV